MGVPVRLTLSAASTGWDSAQQPIRPIHSTGPLFSPLAQAAGKVR